MKQKKIAAFGEAEKGELHIPYFLQDLSQLVDHLGNPPHDSQGLHYAVQALLYKQNLVFFRVEEEGFSAKDYFLGLKYLENADNTHIEALLMPGVGDKEIIQATQAICKTHKSLLIIQEKDLYDYLTSQVRKYS